MNAVRTASIIVTAAGLIALSVGFFLLQKREELIRTWKPFDAQVLKASIEERTDGDATNQATSYWARYELTYTVDGKIVHAIARSDDELLSDPVTVRSKLARHAPGTRGTVYVNPDHPSEVRLNLGRNAATFAPALWVLLAAVFLLLIGTSLWFIGTPAIFW